jgi:hypothetical protein
MNGNTLINKVKKKSKGKIFIIRQEIDEEER